MKYLLLLTLSYNIHAQSYIDDFWQDDQTVKYISNSMSVVQGIDMAEFSENFLQTTKALRQGYISEAIALMGAGAGGSEALKIVLMFDDRVYDRRQIAKRGMGKAIAANFRSGIESLYNNFEDQGGQRKIEISDPSQAMYTPELTWGVKPGAGIYALLKLTNTETGISRTYSAKSKIQNINILGKTLAMLMFHSLHKTRFPLERKLNNKNVEISGIRTLTTASYNQYRNMLRMVDDRCRSLNKRMATSTEMRELFTGFYFGGITRGTAHWAAKDFDYKYMLINYDHSFGTNLGLTNSPSNRTMKYLCVKEIVQTYNF